MQFTQTTIKEITMNKIYIVLLLVSASLFSMEIPTQKVQMHIFGKSIALNSKIIQLSNAKQSVTSLVSGHLEKYFVEAGQKVKSGQKIALIESILVSKMTANYISYKKQLAGLEENFRANKKLYEKGMLALQKLNTLKNELNAMKSNVSALTSQLKTLGINSKKLTKATGNFILHAHSAGRVATLYQPLHTVIREDETVITIVKNQAFYVESYLPLRYANSVKVGQKLTVSYNGRNLLAHVTHVLPELDEKTQRVVVRSSIDEKADDLYINSFVSSTLYVAPFEKYVAVKKSALSFFNNEWVVFIPTEEQEEKKEVAGEEEGEEENVPYEARVLEIITQDEDHVAVRGIELGEEYVSDKSYYVKSMMLKSSLGDGD